MTGDTVRIPVGHHGWEWTAVGACVLIAREDYADFVTTVSEAGQHGDPVHWLEYNRVHTRALHAESAAVQLRADLLTAQRDRDRIYADLEEERKDWVDERKSLTDRLELRGRIDAAKTSFQPGIIWHTTAEEFTTLPGDDPLNVKLVSDLRDVIVSQALEITRLKGEDA